MAPSFLAQCEEHFGTRDLYAVLGCEPTAGAGQLKKAYYKRSLELHPDTNRADDKPAATAKFQVLCRAYSVLSDADKRRVYDECGDVGDDDTGVELSEEFQRWEDYWRLLFPKVTEQRLNDFKADYVGSERETADVKKAYLEFEGDMDKLMESVLFADYPDEERISGIVRQLIQAGEVPAFDAFTDESPARKTRRRRRYQRELREFNRAEAARAKAKRDEAGEDLASAIQLNMRQRAGAMESLIDSLAAKYCTGAKAKAGGRTSNGGVAKKKPKAGKSAKARKA